MLKIDRTTRKLTLGLETAHAQPLGRPRRKYPSRRRQVKGKVSRLMEFGAFVELEPGIEGLIHISELSPNRVRRVADIVKPEQEVEVRILKVEPEARRIGLSLRPSPKAPVRRPTKRKRRIRSRRRGTASPTSRAQGSFQRRPRRPRPAAKAVSPTLSLR